MKRYGGLFGQICSEANIRLAAINAAHGKQRRGEVRKYLARLDEETMRLSAELRGGTYRPGAYEVFEITDPKRRQIYKLPFRDNVVQWAVVQVVGPIWLAQFTADTYSCIKGRGLHAALRRLREDMRRDPEGTAYCLKLDVRKFYPSIDHERLREVLRRKLKDRELLALLDVIIDSAKGVPIGNYLSQYFANLYLSELDHLLKEVAGVRYYYRYADDLVLLAGDKATLHGWLVWINDWLETERGLSLKGNYQIFPVESRGVDFVGYVTRHGYCLARKRNKQGLCREVAKLRKAGVPEAEVMLRTASRAGFMKHCNSKHLMQKLGIKNSVNLCRRSPAT